uniref:Uncharacterized protein n=1 Tax=Chlamydomonas leiostraca TaxID=1034604 RepID=A0A7S0WPC6_9CHLO|eukprot:CAMPEP_0202868950 /NCGR_PEP_ID=MMETSP1391-20130828/11465_1 /ASSEMBLY_ACC=CAM_ASM_000867 /TAXON_ID=1034604 /ORGANISM="Chlamydomonas leiostraca, Strain SAG 11-49" /LENGTH=157 /DNA_ID=CAMNT_0049549183 /DNA_START=39 /DNA_END=512 /DNA_ORIENTATION=+
MQLLKSTSVGGCARGMVMAPVKLARMARPCRVQAGPEDDISEAMKADLERFQRRQQAGSSGASQSQQQFSRPEPAQAQSSGSLKENIDKVLIADFFLVLFALAWLGAGVVLAQADQPGLLNVWYTLWPTLWQSAIGLLMAGALVSGGLGWLQSQQQK